MANGQRVGYIRVSTYGQNDARQLDGVYTDRQFKDEASGKDVHRPQLQAALAFVRDGDTLVVHSMDRLARNVEDLLRLVRELTSRGVTVEFVKNQLVFSGRPEPMAKLMMTMLGAFSEFERELIRERQREGIALAKKRGVYKGRKPALTPADAAEMKVLQTSGMPISAIAKAYSITRETVYQYLRR